MSSCRIVVKEDKNPRDEHHQILPGVLPSRLETSQKAGKCIASAKPTFLVDRIQSQLTAYCRQRRYAIHAPFSFCVSFAFHSSKTAARSQLQGPGHPMWEKCWNFTFVVHLQVCLSRWLAVLRHKLYEKLLKKEN